MYDISKEMLLVTHEVICLIIFAGYVENPW